MQNIKSIEKAIDILSCFTIETPALSVSEISAMTGFSQSTVSRILATLEKKLCMDRDPDSGKYRLGGIKFHQWKCILSQETSIAELARPIMERLRDECGEEVSLYVPGEGNRICAEAVKSRFSVAKITDVGKVLPLHCGAAGKVLLAYLPEKTRKHIYRKPLEKFTPNTITDPAELEADLEKIRRDGYAVSVGEREEGTYSVVAPVMENRADIAASLCVSGPIFRFTEEGKAKLIKATTSAAKEISRTLRNLRRYEHPGT
ncbi:MAG TPA: IclR family transcriptional regulator [Deltaproteobacteria bacterium]|mgnify:CR=1 FL=1|nr:IclR family transcriptional regulator [Deltaproteobacteria bacterium]HQI02352.1 IclR family transcriptional regulator [Deltaproteobacteria bacterium]HQJ09623.1 IclR family transcriptional regulator [Deltaproteobacteria bacterium]